MRIKNTTDHVIFGPPSPEMVKPFSIKPGSQSVPDQYWDFCVRHRNFQKDVLDAGMIELKNLDPLAGQDFKTQLRNLEHLGEFDPEGATTAIRLTDDPELLAKWLDNEDREAVGVELVARLEALNDLG
jgi:hypothetical protein